LPVSWRTDPAPDGPPPAGPTAQDVLIIYTSGTTGNAKGVVLTQSNLAAMARTFVDLYALRAGQRFLSMLPLYHINAPMITGLVCVRARAHIHLTDPYGFTNARSIFDLVEANRINVLSLTPAIMASLLQLNPHGTNRDTSSLELCFCGTAALNETVWRAFEGVFNVPVYQGYGLTETTTWATFTPPDERKRYDTAGVPVGCEVRIDGDPTGEVLIKGNIVMSGYFNKKKLTRKSLRDGWYYSGDVGRFEQDGQLVIVGRTKNIIKRRGVLIHPEAIDAVLRQSGYVADCCSLGIADAAGDERVVTACVPAGISLERVRAFLTENLSPYNRPDEIVAIRAIPRNPVGKPSLPKLRDWISGEATERAVQAFNRYKYSRTPSEQLDEIRALIQQAVLAGEATTIAGLWGVGRRGAIAEPERIAMDRLQALRREMDEAIGVPQFKLLLLLADVHGMCNRVPADRMAPYFEEVIALAASFGIETRMLSELWRDAGLDEADVERLRLDPDTRGAWQAFALRQDFLLQAEKRCGCADLAEDYAFNYYCTCLTERDALTRALKGAIFFTYNAPKHRIVLPELPTIHLHSTKPGTAAKPWFM